MNIDFEEQIISKSNKELIDIYTNPSEYQPQLVALAKQEITRRNIPIDALEALKEKQEAVEAQSLAIGKQGDPIYLTLIGLSAIGGGIPAIIGGYIYAYSTHSDAKGEKYFVYNETTRKWGRVILFIGVGVLSLVLFLRTG